MPRSLRVLITEDVEDDALLVLRELSRGGFLATHERHDTAAAVADALARAPWDLVISDYTMPQLDALAVIRLVRASGRDIPVIIVSGTIGEDTAVHAMKAGAADYLVKGQLKRLVPAVERELREADERAERRRGEETRLLLSETLRASEERFRTLVGSLDDVVFTMDRDRFVDGIFGRRALPELVEELVGADAAAPCSRALAGDTVSYEAVAGGRSYLVSLCPLHDAAGSVVGVVGLGRDVTEQKRVQEQLLLSDRMASVGTLAAGVAHEINNPLAALVANLDFALRELGEVRAADAAAHDTPPHQRHLALLARLHAVDEPLRDARAAGDRVRQIVRDLKVFSRSETGDDKRGPVDVERVLESSVRMAWNEIRHRARLVRDLGAVPPVEANESRLGQVFLNLLVNAAQAIREGDAEHNQIRVATRLERGRVVIDVADTGEGMPPEVLRKLFTPFFSTKPVGSGTGLGLSICHRIVTGLGGEITVESQVGKGSTFRVDLPVAELEDAGESPSPVAPRPGRRGKILVVDDEPLMASALLRMLSREHDVVVIGHAQEALTRLVGGERFDVILCDLMMPHMTGMDLHAELARAVPEQAERMIFMTGGAFTPMARAFLDSTPNQRIEKPFDPVQLAGMIQDRLR